jgi:hypothetical protein
MTDQNIDDIAALRAELTELRRAVARLEAKEEAVAVFNRYLYSLDIDRADEVVACFAPDAVLHVINFPPGKHDDLHLHGPDQIRPLYDRHAGEEKPAIKGGHHSANRGVEVSADARSVEISAYFMTSIEGAGWVQGGQYQLRVERRDEGWLVAEMNIISGWGWRVAEPQRITTPVPAERAWREGRPAVYTAS